MSSRRRRKSQVTTPAQRFNRQAKALRKQAKEAAERGDQFVAAMLRRQADSAARNAQKAWGKEAGFKHPQCPGCANLTHHHAQDCNADWRRAAV